MKKLAISIVLLFFVVTAQAQNLLQGRIVDEATGTGIPFVSVGILGTNNASVSNENGDFVLKAPTYPAKLRCSHVSYLTSDMVLQESSSTPIIVKLKPASISLNTVTIDPYQGQRILKAAFEKAKAYENNNSYVNAFYRQLTTLNGKPSQIYELFFDLQWSPKRVQGWIAKQSRFAQLNEQAAFSLDNQSYYTFTVSGYLFPDNGGKFVNLNTLADYEINVEKYIEQADQKIAVVSCKYKKARKNQYYVNSTYYVGTDDSKIYRLENSVFNLPIRLSHASAKLPPIVTTVATFNGTAHPIPVLESVSTKMYLSLNVKGREINPGISSLLTVYNIDNDLKDQQFEALNRRTKDKTVIESIKYDPNFWRNNPIVKQTTLEDSFIKMMESKAAFGTMTNP
ncbi:carboxypeptidase-like regulatory domain-containing protein [Pedobacter sp. ASV12]|uniref:carboxypeptidase-like regulatory domain-containing protein n=1 Tax=Pedobacter sp. ASV12 TaxID=2795120 RepID=UPI0018EBF6B5|nr:carboxypeptidase-like regulatory domain-containing protein [Pedobacter sp. ASV12]